MNYWSLVAGAVLAAASMPASPSADTGAIGRIKSAMGMASIERAAAPVPASVGSELLAGDWIVTGKDGRIGLTFVDNTRFSVGPDSRIALKQFDYDPTTQKGSFIAQVERGSIAVVSGRMTSGGRSGIQIETPDSTINVNGTRFIVRVAR